MPTPTTADNLRIDEGARDAEFRRYALDTWKIVGRYVKSGDVARIRTRASDDGSESRWTVPSFGVFWKRPDDRNFHVPESVHLHFKIGSPYATDISSGIGFSNDRTRAYLIIDITKAYYASAMYLHKRTDADASHEVYLNRLFHMAQIASSNEVAPIIADAVTRSDTRSTFVHEYTHLLDSVRTIVTQPGDVRKAGFAAEMLHAGKSKDLTDYYLTSTEYNAFYQSVIANFDAVQSSILKDLNTERSMRVAYDAWFSDWKSFRERFESMVTPDPVRKAASRTPEIDWYAAVRKDPKWSKRLEKRLYADWVRYRESIAAELDAKFPKPRAGVVERINSLLHEGSWTRADLPKKFVLVFEFFPQNRVKKFKNPLPNGYNWDHVDNRRVSKAVVQLSKGELHGVQGISASGSIILDFMGTGARDAFLIMDSDDVVGLNKVSRVMYDNPKYLLRDNAAALRRLMAGADVHRVMQGIFDSGLRKAKSHYVSDDKAIDRNMIYQMDYAGLGSHFGIWLAGGSYTPDAPPRRPFNTAADVADLIIEFAKQSTDWHEQQLAGWDRKAWIKFVDMGAKAQAQVYDDEQEWRIKDGVLKVPRGSILYLAQPMPLEMSKFGKLSADEIDAVLKDPDDKRRMFNEYELKRVRNFKRMQAAVKRFGLDSLYTIKYGESIDRFERKRVTRAVRRSEQVMVRP